MKKLNRIRDILLGIVLMAAFVGLMGAATAQKDITVATDLSIYVDGMEMKPTDANGNPVETFIYNGTTYVPLRAVSEYLGKAVKWDGNNRRVYIGEVPGEKQYLLDVCPPYETNYYKSPATITMAGNKYTNGFILSRGFSTDFGYAYFNLNGRYNTLNFDIGHVDGKDMMDGTCDIYLDGKLAVSLDLTSDMLPTSQSIPLNGALQMKIVMDCTTIGNEYGFVNAVLN